MFLSLLGKECRMWLKSILFYAYCIILVMFYISQMESSVITKPSPGKDDYGSTYTTDETAIMNNTVEELIREYENGSFATYPVGFYKEVIPDKQSMDRIGSILSDVVGMEEPEWPVTLTHVREGLAFSEFKEKMAEVAGQIGPGSNYSEESLQCTTVPRTYEQAMDEYEKICKEDRVTGAYARLFCDYVGILLGILPAFFGVARVIRDKRSKSSQVMYTKPASSAVVIAARYLAMVIVLFIPVLILSCFALSQSLYVARALNVAPDYLAFVKYSVIWLLPTILFVTAVSYFIAELTESVLTILISAVMWYAAIFMGSMSVLTFAGWNMLPRFNELGCTDFFQSMYPELMQNRLLYSMYAIVLAAVCVFVYAKKRKGGLGSGRKIWKNRAGKSEA